MPWSSGEVSVVGSVAVGDEDSSSLFRGKGKSSGGGIGWMLGPETVQSQYVRVGRCVQQPADEAAIVQNSF